MTSLSFTSGECSSGQCVVNPCSPCLCLHLCAYICWTATRSPTHATALTASIDRYRRWSTSREGLLGAAQERLTLFEGLPPLVSYADEMVTARGGPLAGLVSVQTLGPQQRVLELKVARRRAGDDEVVTMLFASPVATEVAQVCAP